MQFNNTSQAASVKKIVLIAVLISSFPHGAFATSQAKDGAKKTPTLNEVPRDGNIISEAERRPLVFIQSAVTNLKNHNSQNAVNDLLAAAACIEANSKTSIESQKVSSEPLKLLAADVKMRNEITNDDFTRRLTPLLIHVSSMELDRAKFYWGRAEVHAAGSALNLAVDYFAQSAFYCTDGRGNSEPLIFNVKEIAAKLLNRSDCDKNEVTKALGDFDKALKRSKNASRSRRDSKDKLVCPSTSIP